MPIYEYHCEKCGNKFDVFQQGTTTNNDLECPGCGEPKPRRLFSTFGSGGSTNVSGSYGGGCNSSGPFT